MEIVVDSNDLSKLRKLVGLGIGELWDASENEGLEEWGEKFLDYLDSLALE